MAQVVAELRSRAVPFLKNVTVTCMSQNLYSQRNGMKYRITNIYVQVFSLKAGVVLPQVILQITMIYIIAQFAETNQHPFLDTEGPEKQVSQRCNFPKKLTRDAF